MKQILSLSSFIKFIILICIFTSCSNENIDTKIKKNVEASNFKFSFNDYGEDVEVESTRTIQSPDSTKDTFAISKNICAEVCIRRESVTKSRRTPLTRSVPSGRYTIIAYKNGVIQGEISGTINGSSFTPDPSGPKSLQLEPGKYDFVCYNDKVNREGNSLIVNQADAYTALIGRTTNVTISGLKYSVRFTMNHVCARMKIKIKAYMPFPQMTATVSDVANNIPSKAIYNTTTGTYSYNNGSGSTNYTVSAILSTLYMNQSDYSYNSSSNDYGYFLPGTELKNLRIRFNSGTIYYENMAGANSQLNPSPSLTMKENGSYVVIIRLLYNYWYLFSDGDIGTLQEKPNKIPVGLIVSRGNRLAAALKESGGGQYKWSRTQRQINTYMYGSTDWNILNDMNGYNWTWDPNTTAYNHAIKKGEDGYTTPAFNAAASYSPGVGFTGGLSGHRWFLPSLGQWKLLFTGVAFGTMSALPPNIRYDNHHTCKPDMVNVGFTQAGGVPMRIGANYWSSSEIDVNMVAIFGFNSNNAFFGTSVNNKTIPGHTRPFIIY